MKRLDKIEAKIDEIDLKTNIYDKIIKEKLSETDFKQLANKIDLNNLKKLKEITDLVEDNKKQIIKSRLKIMKCIDILDTLLVNHTELYEKTETIDCFIHGYVKALGAELGNQREAFYYMYKALDLPYDEIKGWDINNDTKKKKRRRPISLLCKIIRRKKKKRKGKKRNVNQPK
jgi:hypothetical protein